MDEREAEDRKHSRTVWLLFADSAMIAICVLTFLLLFFGKGELLANLVSSITLILLGAFGVSKFLPGKD